MKFGKPIKFANLELCGESRLVRVKRHLSQVTMLEFEEKNGVRVLGLMQTDGLRSLLGGGDSAGESGEPPLRERPVGPGLYPFISNSSFLLERNHIFFQKLVLDLEKEKNQEKNTKEAEENSERQKEDDKKAAQDEFSEFSDDFFGSSDDDGDLLDDLSLAGPADKPVQTETTGDTTAAHDEFDFGQFVDERQLQVTEKEREKEDETNDKTEAESTPKIDSLFEDNIKVLEEVLDQLEKEGTEWVLVENNFIGGRVFRFEEGAVGYGSIDKERIWFFSQGGHLMLQVDKKEISDAQVYVPDDKGEKKD